MPSSTEQSRLSTDEPLLYQLHQAASMTDPKICLTGASGELDTRDDGFSDADEIVALDHEPIAFDGQGELERLILARRSCRRFDPKPIGTDDLGGILSYAYQPSLPLREDRKHEALRQMFDPTLLDTYLVVNRAIDMEPGIYYYAPIGHELRQVKAGDMVEASRHICLGQELGADAAVLLIHTANLEQAIARYGDRAYRYLHLDAGYLGERLNLVAQVKDLGTSGIGGFYDDDVTRMLGLSGDHAVLYITTLGHAHQEDA